MDFTTYFRILTDRLSELGLSSERIDEILRQEKAFFLDLSQQDRYLHLTEEHLMMTLSQYENTSGVIDYGSSGSIDTMDEEAIAPAVSPDSSEKTQTVPLSDMADEKTRILPCPDTGVEKTQVIGSWDGGDGSTRVIRRPDVTETTVPLSFVGSEKDITRQAPTEDISPSAVSWRRDEHTAGVLPDSTATIRISVDFPAETEAEDPTLAIPQALFPLMAEKTVPISRKKMDADAPDRIAEAEVPVKSQEEVLTEDDFSQKQREAVLPAEGALHNGRQERGSGHENGRVSHKESSARLVKLDKTEDELTEEDLCNAHPHFYFSLLFFSQFPFLFLGTLCFGTVVALFSLLLLAGFALLVCFGILMLLVPVVLSLGSLCFALREFYYANLYTALGESAVFFIALGVGILSSMLFLRWAPRWYTRLGRTTRRFYRTVLRLCKNIFRLSHKGALRL